MNYNLHDIKAEITNNVAQHFMASQDPKLSDYPLGFTFGEGVDLFFKVVIYKVGIFELDGLTKTVIPTLHEAFITRRGELAPVKLLASELEGYLKKLTFLLSSGTNNFSNDRSKTLLPLYNHLALASSIPISSSITEATLNGNPKDKEFLWFLCKTYLVRNMLHKSPNWRLSDSAINLEAVVVTYLHATFKYFLQLQACVNSIILPGKIEPTESQPDPKKQALYDFIYYNNGTSQIRNQIVISFFLHTLSSNGGAASLEQIQKACNNQFNTTAEKSFYKSIAKDLSKPSVNKVILDGLFDDDVSLTESESMRIKKLREDFYFQEKMFALEIREILKAYDIEDKTDYVIEKLTNLFKANYDIDFKEMIDKGSEAIDNVQSVKDFLSSLKKIVTRDTSAESVFKQLMATCTANDFLNRISVGEVFAKVSNLSQIEEYYNQRERIVYLDTNVLLHVLCCYYEDTTEYDNVHYQTAREFLRYADRHQNVILRTTDIYTQEVAFQFKEALLLVAFEELGIFTKIESSNNVLFKFYVGLRRAGILEDDVTSFADFLKGFQLEEENLEDKSFLFNTTQLVAELLEYMNIEVINLPQYSKEDMVELIKNSLTMSGKFKDLVPMNNDAIMVCHIGDKNYHEIEPTFVTWDTSFFDIRKRFVKKFTNCIMWHLFTPNKFLNHALLLEFKIDSSNVTNDFISLIDSINIQEKTKNILDLVSQLLDIEKEERRRYVTKFKEFTAKYVFNIDDPISSDNDLKNSLKPIEKVITELYKYYSDKKNKYNFGDLRKVFMDKTLFDDVIGIIQEALELYMKDRLVPSTVFASFDELIRKKKEP